MSHAKTMSFLPLPPMSPSDDEAKKSPLPVRDKVAISVSQIAQSSGTSNCISPVPTHKNIKTMYGQLLTPAPGRLTPIGRIKAPPVCLDPSLKRVASSIDEFNTAGVCFSPKEADSCAEKALALDGNVSGNCMEEMPFNVENCDVGFSWKSHVNSTASAQSLEENKAQLVSSNSTVVTTSSASSCGGSVMGNGIAVIASVAVEKDPPLEVVQTDLAVISEDENTRATSAPQQPRVLDAKVTTTVTAKSLQPAIATEMASSSTSLSTTFTNNLVKEKSSRQGRSLQRWLIHSPTDELVRQVAGTIPITRDGRIILISASRKTEWILPKGGWDVDETKEECAARETYEEGGLLGRLGGCLEPIDYETAKARKRRLSKLGGDAVVMVDGKEQGNGKSNASGKLKRSKGEDEGLLPPLPKRVKADKLMASISTESELTSSTTKNAGVSESTCSSGANRGNNAAAHQSATPAATTSFDPKKYSYVRLSLFPLYVSSVKSDWPEKGRIRKLVDIDEAIKIMDAENRLYFKRGLEMVKERGLHLLKP